MDLARLEQLVDEAFAFGLDYAQTAENRNTQLANEKSHARSAKRCPRCRGWKNPTKNNFDNDRRRRDGLRSWCRVCEGTARRVKICQECEESYPVNPEFFRRDRRNHDNFSGTCHNCEEFRSVDLSNCEVYKTALAVEAAARHEDGNILNDRALADSLKISITTMFKLLRAAQVPTVLVKRLHKEGNASLDNLFYVGCGAGFKSKEKRTIQRENRARNKKNDIFRAAAEAAIGFGPSKDISMALDQARERRLTKPSDGNETRAQNAEPPSLADLLTDFLIPDQTS